MKMTAEVPWEISCDEVRQMQQSGEAFALIDCREPDEHAVARITGAELLPMSQIAGRVGELEAKRNDRIVVHCHHGGRSLRVAQWLREQGFSQAQSMAGGIDEWSQKIDPRVPRY
jgi:rhodanese-related sulfurtransferase